MAGKQISIEQCADAAGSVNAPSAPNLPSYVPPEVCVGTFTLTEQECATAADRYQESLAAENLNVSGAPINVFKLLGIHEQGKLIDLTGNGSAIGSGSPEKAFDALLDDWVSSETGTAVSGKSYIGYDFGIRKTTYDQPQTGKHAPENQHITSFRITQGDAQGNRALQIRVERSVGKFYVDPLKVKFTGNGNGGIGSFTPGVDPQDGYFMLFAEDSNSFMVAFTSAKETKVLGIAQVNQKFNSTLGSFTINAGSIPFAAGDSFTVPLQMEWLRVDVVNLPDTAAPVLVRIKQSASSRYWRLVPTSFGGAMSNEPWIIKKLEFFDYQATRLDDIQDPLLMENRDRDYATASIQLKASYTPFDSMMDMSKFGFQMADIYTFNVSFAMMVTLLGRPIVVGDILELPAEMQYDHNLRPVRRFLEVSDVGWAADGFTTGWKPIIYRFQAQQLIPAQEHRDLLGTVNTQKYIIDDGTFMLGSEQIQTMPLTTTESNYQDALEAVPEKGTNVREYASGTNRFNRPGSYDGVGLYVEDGLPPDGMPYKTGFNKLPDVADSKDGEFFRLEYPAELNMPARLYKFNGIKNKWVFVEADRRSSRSSHKPSQRAIFDMENKMSPKDQIK